jgi:hypothetical protein
MMGIFDNTAALILGMFTLVILLAVCCAPPMQRQQWQDCGGYSHEVCWDVEDYRACEHEFYMECINAESP